MLAPGPVPFAPLIRGLVGGSQVHSKAQVTPQEEAQHRDKAQEEDNAWEGQEQVLGAKKRHVRKCRVPALILSMHTPVTTSAAHLHPMGHTEGKSEPSSALTNSPEIVLVCVTAYCGINKVFL